MYNSIIMPIVGLIALVVGALFHITITEDVKLQVVEVVGGLVSLIFVVKGIITNHKKVE